MPLRLDMLDDATLEAATSRGLVRRAHRDVETGTARLRRHDDGEAVIEMSDAVVTLRPGGLAAATCTCPSRETCRHMLAAILLLRNTPPDDHGEKAGPGNGPQDGESQNIGAPSPKPDPIAEIMSYTKAQLEKAFGRALLSRAAEELPAAAEVAITISDAVCIVAFHGLPEVRYVAGLGIQGMVCKGSGAKAKMLRAQALLAVRRAQDPGHAVADHAAAEPPPVVDETAEVRKTAPPLDRAGAVLIDWALAGLAAAPEPLEDRLFEAAIAARAGGLFRLSADLRRLSEDVRRRRERDAEHTATDSLRVAARAFALVEATRRSPGDQALRGRARDAFDTVGDIALVGCGFEIWKTPTDARGATAYFYAPSERRWFSASLARGSGQDPGFVPEQAVEREPVWGATLERLSGCEVFLHGAAAAPNGRLSLSRDIRASVKPVCLAREDVAQWEGSFEDWSALDAFIRARFAPSLRGARRATEVAVLLPARTGRPGFDEIAQELIVPLFDRHGRQLNIAVASVPHRERRLLALEEILTDRSPDAFFVAIAAAGDRPTLSPYALLAGPDAAPVSLDACGRTKAKEKGVRSLSGKLRRRIDELGTDLARAAAPPTSTVRLLGAASDQLLGLCELGGQMQDPRLIENIGVLANRIESTGLRPAALLLTAVTAASGRTRAEAVLVAAHALNVLIQLLRPSIC